LRKWPKKPKRDAIEARNVLENTIYQAEKMVRDNKEKLSEEDVKTLEDAVKAAKELGESDDAEKLQEAVKDLNDKIMPIGAKMYENAKDEPTAGGSDDDADDNDDKDSTVEGEVVDDEKE
jgi:molecular chaperone DnaK